jgi:GT2 family glycosyltransferase
MIPCNISIIILMHNKISMTKDCLSHLAKAIVNLDHEVIVLDNASTEDTESIRMCSEWFHRFRIIRIPENTAFSSCNNFGVLQAGGDWLLFLNNDAFVKPDAVQRLRETAVMDAKIGATGGKLLYPGENTVQQAGICQMLWDHPSNYGVGADPNDKRISQSCDRFALSGAMLYVSRTAYEDVGGFDERYLWGTEDIDLCLKIRATGLRCVYCPDAIAVHLESATIKTTHAGNAEGNCALFRRLWDPVLQPLEEKYVHQMKEQGIRRVVVFGMGSAARGMSRILIKNNIEIVAYTASVPPPPGATFLGKPVLPLEEVRRESFDRLMVASQHFFAVEPVIRACDPQGEPIYPVLM